MITEDYVSFETAKLLKEKGFDVYTYAYYEDEDNPNISLRASKAINWNKTEFISRPTLQMVMKWLREVHHIHIEVHLDSMDGRHPIYEALYSECVTIRTDNFIDYGDTYEQACEAAIKYCLENLI